MVNARYDGVLRCNAGARTGVSVFPVAGALPVAGKQLRHRFCRLEIAAEMIAALEQQEGVALLRHPRSGTGFGREDHSSASQ